MSARPAAGRDAALGIAALALAAVYGFAARDLPQSLLADPVGASGLPVLYAIVLAVLAIVLVVRAWRSREPVGDVSTTEGSAHAGVLRAFGLLLPGIAYLLLVGALGYFVSILLLIVAVAWYTGARPGATLLAVGFAGAVAMWITFVLLFGIPLPAGSLWPFPAA